MAGTGTPAVMLAQRSKIEFTVHEYAHDPRAAGFGTEAVEALGLDPARTFKTLVAATSAARPELVVGVVPVAAQLDLKRLAAASGVTKLVMADARDAERATGSGVGGISPLGQKRRLTLVVDTSATNHATVFVSAGRRGLEIELAPADLVRLAGGTLADIAKWKA